MTASTDRPSTTSRTLSPVVVFRCSRSPRELLSEENPLEAGYGGVFTEAAEGREIVTRREIVDNRPTLSGSGARIQPSSGCVHSCAAKRD